MKRPEWTERFEQVCKDTLVKEIERGVLSMVTSHDEPYVTAAMKMDSVLLPEGTLCEVNWGHGYGPCPDTLIQQAVEMCRHGEKVVVFLLVDDATMDVIDKRVYIPNRIMERMPRLPDDSRSFESMREEEEEMEEEL